MAVDLMESHAVPPPSLDAARADHEYLEEVFADFGLAPMLLPGFRKTPRTDLPIGIAASDQFFDRLEELSGRPIPQEHRQQRDRLIDALVAAHEELLDRRAVVCADEELSAGLVSLLAEMGIVPVLCIGRGPSESLRRSILEVEPGLAPQVLKFDGLGLEELVCRAEQMRPDFILGQGVAVMLAQCLGIPFVRAGEPDTLHFGYHGALETLERVKNALLNEAA